MLTFLINVKSRYDNINPSEKKLVIKTMVTNFFNFDHFYNNFSQKIIIQNMIICLWSYWSNKILLWKIQWWKMFWRSIGSPKCIYVTGGYLVYDHFGVKKSHQKLHFDHKLHMMSHRLIIWEVRILIDYECPDYSS